MTSFTKKRVFVVIPAYNESRTIAAVVSRVLVTYPNVVVVDDGSTDDTSARVEQLPAYVLRHLINRGQGAALQTGIQFSLIKGADVVVTFDADGQHDEQDIKALIEPILSGDCHVTLGSRFLGHAHDIPFTRKLVLKLGVLFTRAVSRVQVSDVHNGLRAFSRQAAASLHITMDRMAHASEILDQIKEGRWSYLEVPVNVYYSPYSIAKGQSSWNALNICAELLLKKVAK